MLVYLYAVIKSKWLKTFIFWETSQHNMKFKSENRTTSKKRCLQSRRIEDGKVVAENNELVSIFRKEFDIFKEKTDSDIRDIKSRLRKRANISLAD